MRRGMSLIELIFSMVIIAIAFTVFPKLLQISAKSTKTSLKEEAMYNAVALMGLIKSLPWDEKNTLYDDILITNGGSDYECSYSFGGGSIYRKGGFVGSRQCPRKEDASTIGDDGDTIPDDIDDFDGESIDASDSGAFREYNITVDVKYVEDTPYHSEDLNGSESTSTTNSKYIAISIRPLKKASVLGDRFTSFWYVSYNIGQLHVANRPWKDQ